MFHGRDIRTTRIARGLTQSQLASRVGVSRQTLAAWEGGAAPRGLSVYLRLLSELDLVHGTDTTTLNRLCVVPDFPRGAMGDIAPESEQSFDSMGSAEAASGPPFTPYAQSGAGASIDDLGTNEFPHNDHAPLAASGKSSASGA